MIDKEFELKKEHKICCMTCKWLKIDGIHYSCEFSKNCLTIGIKPPTEYYDWPRKVNPFGFDYTFWKPLYPIQTLPDELFEI